MTPSDQSAPAPKDGFSPFASETIGALPVSAEGGGGKARGSVSPPPPSRAPPFLPGLLARVRSARTPGAGSLGGLLGPGAPRAAMEPQGPREALEAAGAREKQTRANRPPFRSLAKGPN